MCKHIIEDYPVNISVLSISMKMLRSHSKAICIPVKISDLHHNESQILSVTDMQLYCILIDKNFYRQQIWTKSYYLLNKILLTKITWNHLATYAYSTRTTTYFIKYPITHPISMFLSVKSHEKDNNHLFEKECDLIRSTMYPDSWVNWHNESTR